MKEYLFKTKIKNRQRRLKQKAVPTMANSEKISADGFTEKLDYAAIIVKGKFFFIFKYEKKI